MTAYTQVFVFSRTLTSVYDAILQDLVYPAEIVGKRIQVKTDGKQLIKVHLDKNQQTNIDHKVSNIHPQTDTLSLICYDISLYTALLTPYHYY